MSFNKKDIETAKEILKTSPMKLDLIQEVKKKKFRLSDLDINPRNAVHWELKGLFLNKKQEGRWHLLDLSEATWILILQKMREFNFKLEIISDLKDNFLNHRYTFEDETTINEIKKVVNNKAGKNVDYIMNSRAFDEFIKSLDYTMLEWILMDIIHLRNSYRILFNLKGHYILIKEGATNHPLQDYVTEFLSESHFSLSINEIVAELLGKIDLNLAHDSYQIISAEELKVLNILRTEDIHSVEISMNPLTGKPETIKCTELSKPAIQTRLFELIMRNGYQEITIKTQNGIVSHCKNTIS